MKPLALFGRPLGFPDSPFLNRVSVGGRPYRCQAGLESLRIKGDGQIFRAVCSVGGSIGRLVAAVELPVSGIVCDRAACNCVADILITKIWEDAAQPT